MASRTDIQLKLPATEPKTVISELKAARVLEVDERGHYNGGMIVDCMFNPYQYTLSKSNTYKPYDSANGSNSPKAELTQSGAQTLQLELFFDTTQIQSVAHRNVALVTNELWKFMSVKEAIVNQKKVNPQAKAEAPLVAFHWGVFHFVAYITNMSQEFTLFAADGTPVRAKVKVTFTQYVDLDDYPGQNPTSGDGPIQRVWRVVAGDRLDLIAAEVYRDATRWRQIASHNNLINPLNLRPGTVLRIPYQ